MFENKKCKNLKGAGSCSDCSSRLAMSLYSYFAEASKRSELPNPNGSLLASVSPTAIKEANKAVKSVTSLKERASGEGVTLNSNLSSKLQSASMPLYMATKRLFGTSLSSWA